jgi:hypothetical protein
MAVPTLLELQTAMRQSLVHRDIAAVSAMLAAHVAPDRLDIYRNTFLLTLTKALRLCFPAVQKLVGEEFFEDAAQVFIAERPPRAAWLDQYGAEFSDFLCAFGPAASVPYLDDVAKLEWAVNCALHAADAEPLDAARLARVAPEDQGRIRLIANPSIALVQLGYPADTIWRAVLAGDDDALQKIDLDCGPVHILVERRTRGVEVERLDVRSWEFLAVLCAGEPIETAIVSSGGLDCSSALAEHLALGRFRCFELAPDVGERVPSTAIPR